MDARADKFTRMTTQPVKKLVLRLAGPTIASMLISSLYNMADTFFVGRIGTFATAGVGLIFPLMTVMQAFGFFFGQGSGNYVSRALGANRIEDAERMAATGFFCALGMGALIFGLGQVFSTPVLRVLGADPGRVAQETVDHARAYYTTLLFGAPFVLSSCVLNNQMRFQGNAFFSMIGLVSGAVLNIGLDPLFIFVFNMGVMGAAAATVVSQAFSFCVLYLGTLRSDTLKIKVKNLTPNGHYLKNILAGGLPSLLRQGFGSVATLCLNAAAAAAVPLSQADAAIAAFSVVSRVMFFVFSALLGFGQGFQPVCGYNWGARKFDRVREAYLFCIKIGVTFLLLISTCTFLFAGPIVSLFRDDAEVIRMGTVAMRCQSCSLPLMAVVAMSNMLFQTTGKAVRATILAIARQGMVFIPCVLLLPRVIDPAIWGVYLAQPIADVITFLTAVPMAVHILKRFRLALQDPDFTP
jgi:putative MATE family efflux protein